MSGMRGRIAGVKFPIRWIEVSHGQDFERTVEEGAEVRCLRCKEPFRIDRDTACHIRHPLDESVYIRCPSCGYMASVVYYYDQTRKERLKL